MTITRYMGFNGQPKLRMRKTEVAGPITIDTSRGMDGSSTLFFENAAVGLFQAAVYLPPTPTELAYCYTTIE